MQTQDVRSRRLEGRPSQAQHVEAKQPAIVYWLAGETTEGASIRCLAVWLEHAALVLGDLLDVGFGHPVLQSVDRWLKGLRRVTIVCELLLLLHVIILWVLYSAVFYTAWADQRNDILTEAPHIALRRATFVRQGAFWAALGIDFCSGVLESTNCVKASGEEKCGVVAANMCCRPGA